MRGLNVLIQNYDSLLNEEDGSKCERLVLKYFKKPCKLDLISLKIITKVASNLLKEGRVSNDNLRIFKEGLEKQYVRCLLIIENKDYDENTEKDVPTIKAHIYSHLSDLYLTNNDLESKIKAFESIEKYSKIKDNYFLNSEKEEVTALVNYKKAIEIGKETFELNQDISFMTRLSKFCVKVAEHYESRGDFKSAHYYFFKGAKNMKFVSSKVEEKKTALETSSSLFKQASRVSKGISDENFFKSRIYATEVLCELVILTDNQQYKKKAQKLFRVCAEYFNDNLRMSKDFHFIHHLIKNSGI
jgi:tetratricopeptide (TPR) repeat protein